MSHPFGDQIAQHLHRKHGLSQSKLAAGILQSPSIITEMCQGKRLQGYQARERIIAIITWLAQQGVLTALTEADALLTAAGMAGLNPQEPAEQRLLQQLASQPSPALTPAKPARRPTNLPASLTSFVGRTQELTEVAQLVASHRLVTLTGAGGVGKTRLALEVGKAILDYADQGRADQGRRLGSGDSAATQSANLKAADREPFGGVRIIQNRSTEAHEHLKFSDGVWFVELAALSTGEMATTVIAQAIARLFKPTEHTSRPPLEALQAYLSDKHLLLVLDNCEHLVDACAEVCEQLLQHCWQLHILATSREEVRIPGEVLYPVLPLALPSATEHDSARVLACASAQLFVERMRATQPGLLLPAAEIATLAQICRQLDGIPLALELAAPLARSLSLAEIARQLDNQMALLTNNYRTAIPRHQTMHSALIWSYRLLSLEEQQLLAKASVFAGGWTLEAAGAVCVDAASPHITPAHVAPLLNQLSAKSWVLIETMNDQRRYRLLEPVRQFAHTQLVASGQQEETQRDHAHYFLGLAEQLDQARDTPQEHAYLQRLEPERNNLRAVNGWAFAHNEVEFAQQFNGFLFAFWIYCSSLAEASHWLEGALALQGPKSKAERTPRERRVEAAALDTAGYTAALGFNVARAQALFTRELDLRRELGEAKWIAQALRGISFTFMLSNNLSQAQLYSEQSLAIARAASDYWGIAWSLFGLGYQAMVRNELTVAQTLLEEALPLLQEQGINFGVFRAQLALGHVMRAAGNNVPAHQFYTDALRLQQQMHYLPSSADGLEGLAAIATGTGDLIRAVRIFGAAHAHRQASGWLHLDHQEAGYQRDIAAARSQLSTKAWDTAWAEGSAMTLEQAVEYALTS